MRWSPDLIIYDQVTDPVSRLVPKCDEPQSRESLELIFKLRLHGNIHSSGGLCSWFVRRG